VAVGGIRLNKGEIMVIQYGCRRDLQVLHSDCHDTKPIFHPYPSWPTPPSLLESELIPPAVRDKVE
jgi:hypothetical protein